MNDKQKRFIMMRAESISFDAIATELKTAKSTLIQWSRLFIDDIKDLEFLSMQRLKEEYSNNQVQKYKKLLEHLNKLDEGIAGASFEDEKIKDLFTIRNNIAYQLDSMEKSTVYKNTGLVEKCEYTGDKTSITLKLNEL